MERLKVTVSKDHSTDGMPGMPHRNPIALAFRDRGFRFVSVNQDGVWFRVKGSKRDALILHTRGSRRFFNLVDAGENPVAVSPISFRFDVAHVKAVKSE